MRKLLREGFDRRYVVLPLLAAVTIVIAAFFVAEARRAYTRDLSEAILVRQDRMREIAELIYASIEAESAQRGYMLTGEAQYLEPYAEGRKTATTLIDDLIRRYEETNAEEAAVLQGVRTRLDVKFVETEQTIAMMREGRAREALAAVKTDVGLHYMREIRDELEALRTRERLAIYDSIEEWKQELRVNTVLNAVTAVFTLVLLVLVGLLASSEIRRRHAANTELERLVEQRTADLEALSAHMVRIGELEKSALARELHDELGGLLVAMRMDLAQLRRRIVLPDGDAEARWKRIDSALAAGVELKRRVIEELRPTLLDNMGLAAAIRWQAEQSCAVGQLKLDLDLPDEEPALSGDTGIAAFRCVQEALSNVLKHARATRVKLAMRRSGEWLQIVVEDDGVGVAPGAVERAGSHGLKQMRFRMEAVGGEMSTESVLPRGTRTTLSLRL
jgi:signal transduction histidine kinase